MAPRDLLDGLAHRGHAAVRWLLGTDRTAVLGRWFAAAYRDQPLLFGLVVTWLAFCAVPLAAFAGYAALWAVVAFAVFWAILLFWAGVGLLFLVPALCVATGLSVVVFVWAAVTYAAATRVLALLGYGWPSSSSTSSSTSPDKPPSYYQPYPVTKTVGKTSNGGGGGNGLDKPKTTPPAAQKLAAALADSNGDGNDISVPVSTK